MAGPISGDRSSSNPYGSQANKKNQNPTEIIIEIEDILQQKLHDGKISIPEFTTLSKRLEAIQEQYQGNEKKENKAHSQTLNALSQLKSDINTISGDDGGTTTAGH